MKTAIAIVIVALLMAGYASAAGSSCDINDFPALFKYGEEKNRNLATALYSITAAFKEQKVEVTPHLLAAIMATLEKEVGGENFLPVEETGDYGMGAGCTYKIGGKCRSTPYSGGVDYKGRGYIQLTGKENYAKYCGADCVGASAPELDVCGCKNKKQCTVADENACPQAKALTPEYAGKIFAAYYLGTSSGKSSLAVLAEHGDYKIIGGKINGGQGYADDFAAKAEEFLKLLESGQGQSTQLLDCLDASPNQDYCAENSLCAPGKECDLGTHTCQYKQAPKQPGPQGCASGGYLFACNDPISTAIKKYAPNIFKAIVPNSECQPGYLYGDDGLCHPACGSGTYCAAGSQCYSGQCLACGPGYAPGEGGMCYPEPGDAEGKCDIGYVLGDDSFCHSKCGIGETYCAGDSLCYNGECLACDPGYYLATDGMCYPDNGGEDTGCPVGYLPGDDELCHLECGNSGTYCIGDSQCYGNECLACDPGYYLATDGMCYPDDGGEDTGCPVGYLPGDDKLCHLECGTDTYCTGISECFNGECLSCDDGYYLATDGQCYPDLACDKGFILGEDSLCHPACGTDTYCTGDSQCFKGQCLGCDAGHYLATDGQCYPDDGNNGGDRCDYGYVYGDDGLCHKQCGLGDTYCIGDSQCYFGQCLSCEAGYYLGTDGRCYPEGGGGGGYCDPGYIPGGDGYCYPECGNSGTYCASDSQCFNGQCLSCDSGYYLATDGRCYPEGGGGGGGGSYCAPGSILGDDNYCYPECGNSGTYCIGNSQCFNGQCLSCDSGYYLGTDGRCYPEGGGGGGGCDPGYIPGDDGYCHSECGNSGTYCIGDSQCFNGQCLGCDSGYYLATDGRCYPEGGGGGGGGSGGGCPDGYYPVTDNYCCEDGSFWDGSGCWWSK